MDTVVFLCIFLYFASFLTLFCFPSDGCPFVKKVRRNRKYSAYTATDIYASMKLLEKSATLESRSDISP